MSDERWSGLLLGSPLRLLDRGPAFCICIPHTEGCAVVTAERARAKRLFLSLDGPASGECPSNHDRLVDRHNVRSLSESTRSGGDQSLPFGVVAIIVNAAATK
jgi:hypothetical protein